MATLKALITFHDRLLQLATTLRFNKRDPVDLHRIGLYGTLLELTGCIICLMNTKIMQGYLRYSARFGSRCRASEPNEKR